MLATDRVFAGGGIRRGDFVAEIEQSRIATWPDCSARFDDQLPSKSPCRGAELGYEANKRDRPAVGTRGTVVVSRER